jgi:hypothetical protein
VYIKPVAKFSGILGAGEPRFGTALNQVQVTRQIRRGKGKMTGHRGRSITILNTPGAGFLLSRATGSVTAFDNMLH